MTKLYEGPMVALATPFRDGGIDEDAYRALIRYQLENGTHGLIPIGTTGEAVTMTEEERGQAIRLTVDETRGRALVIAGAGSNSTAETITAVGRAREAGADAALVVTPFYNKPTQAGLFEHYRAVAKAHPRFPLVAYNVPGRTGVDMLPDTVQRLCELDEVVAIKEATGNMARAVDILEKCGDRLSLLSGDDFTVLPLISVGGRGCISVSANVAPRMMSDLVAAARKGDLRLASSLQLKLNGLHRLLFVESNPIPVKGALRLMGMFGPDLRLPLTPLGEGNAARLREELTRLGLPVKG